jgi:hypothetical protein
VTSLIFRGRRLLGKRDRLGYAGWGLADQALSSLSNFGAGLVAARASTTEAFGAFSIAFATAMLGIGVVRALVSEVYSVRYSGGDAGLLPGGSDPDDLAGSEAVAAWVEAEHDVEASAAEPAGAVADRSERYPHAGGAWGAALLISLVASAGCLVAAALASGSLRASFVVLAIGMPGLVLQDSARYICMARRDAVGAALSDGIWVVAFAGVVIGLAVVNGEFPGATASLAAWVFGATCGAVAAGLRMWVWPRIGEGMAFARRVWRHSARYIIDWLSLGATVQLSYYVLGFTAGLAVVGEFRAALLLVGPLNIVVMGAVMILVPELTRYRRRTGGRLFMPAISLTVLLEVVAIVWVAIIAALPASALETLLGDAATDARPLLPEVFVMMSFGLMAQGPLVCLRATGDVRRGTKASLPSAPFQLLGAAVGAAITGGAGGALLGAATGGLVSGVLGTYQLIAATREAPIVFDAVTDTTPPGTTPPGTAPPGTTVKSPAQGAEAH